MYNIIIIVVTIGRVKCVDNKLDKKKKIFGRHAKVDESATPRPSKRTTQTLLILKNKYKPFPEMLIFLPSGTLFSGRPLKICIRA